MSAGEDKPRTTEPEAKAAEYRRIATATGPEPTKGPYSVTRERQADTEEDVEGDA
ncbi:hypothetical protein ACFU3O_13875 [Streptomyces antibioticus]|uniref:hypothetical protein n=1 Tax=Streptomyces antibioticus TaxID=1890 RepID=UPI0036989FA7